jgi:hypothetical protein
VRITSFTTGLLDAKQKRAGRTGPSRGRHGTYVAG